MKTYIVRILKKRHIKGTTSKPRLRKLLASSYFESQNSIDVHEDCMPAKSRLPIICLTLAEGKTIMDNSYSSDLRHTKCPVDGVYKLFEDYIIAVKQDSDIMYDPKTKVLYVCGYPISDVTSFGTLDEHNCFDVHYYREELKVSDTLTLGFFKRSGKDAIIFVSNSVYNSKRTEVILIHNGQLHLPTEVTYPPVFKNKRVTAKWLLSLPTASAFSKLTKLRQQTEDADDDGDEDPLGYLTPKDLRKKLGSMDRLSIEHHVFKYFDLDDEDAEDIVECDDGDLIETVINMYLTDEEEDEEEDEDEDAYTRIDVDTRGLHDDDSSVYTHQELSTVIIEELRLALAERRDIDRSYLLCTPVDTLVRVALSVIADADYDFGGGEDNSSVNLELYMKLDLDSDLTEELRLELARFGIERKYLLGAPSGTLIKIAIAAIDQDDD